MKPNALLNTLTLSMALVASSHAAVYSTETFNAGTPNYSINGVNSTASPNSWFVLPGQSNVTAMVGTGYTADAGSRNGIVANGEPTDISPGGTIPSGNHAFISTSANRRLTSTYAMNLATNNATSLDISLKFMSYSLGGHPALGSSEIVYSALGDFTDTISLATFGIGQNNSTVVTPDFQAAEETWSSLSASFTEAGSGITFTDTAAIRIQRVALVSSAVDTTRTAENDNTNHITFLDDITVSSTEAIPEPSSFALFILGGLALLRRKRA